MQRYQINRNKKEEFLQLFLNEAFENGDLNMEEIQSIQEQLFDILGRITMECSQNSPSISIDKAEQIVASICYQISYGLIHSEKEIGVNLVIRLKTIPMWELYQEGHNVIQQDVDWIRSSYDKMINDSYFVVNRAFEDTLQRGFPEFFANYDSVCRAHEWNGSFDYPISVPCKDQDGVGYVKEYVNSLQQEIKFCQHFEENILEEIANGFSKDYYEHSFNLYDVVLENVIGSLLLDKSLDQVMSLSLTKEEQIQLETMFCELGLLELEDRARNRIRSILEETTPLEETTLRAYIMESIPRLIRHCHQNARNHMMENCLILREQNKVQKVMALYDCEERFEPSRLQALIEELEYETNLQDKIMKIRRRIHNGEDLMEILTHCIYGEEAKELFLLLEDQELALLMVKVLLDSESDAVMISGDCISWHMELMMFLQQQDQERQARINQLIAMMSKC